MRCPHAGDLKREHHQQKMLAIWGDNKVLELLLASEQRTKSTDITETVKDVIAMLYH